MAMLPKTKRVYECLSAQLESYHDGDPSPLLDDAGMTGEMLKKIIEKMSANGEAEDKELMEEAIKDVLGGS